MFLFPKETYENRRELLRNKVGEGIIFISGNTESPMNYTDNIYRFRQDSNFRYFFGIDLPNLHAIINCDTGEEIIFGREYTMDDIIWVGPQKSLRELAAEVGVDRVSSPDFLGKYVNNSNPVHFTPPYRHDNQILLGSLLGEDPKKIKEKASVALIQAIVSIRSYKSPEEMEQLHHAVNITRSMHLAAMRHTRPGKYEYEVVAEIRKKHFANHANLAYPVIFSVNGQILHNHHHNNKMEDGRLVLNDSGAENPYGYAGDITRTFPVNGRFSARQKDIYSIVLEMEKTAIESLRPGIAYRDVHLNSNRLMLERLKNLGLVQGDVEDMLVAGVGGLFMPHGLGHMIGMDVHDMEDLGEQYVGYGTMERSTQLGLKSLRLARELEEGFVLTVEPGIYFIPELIDKMRLEDQYPGMVNWNKLEEYKGFGGVRIEDNILITGTGHELVGQYIIKEIDEIEDYMQQ